MGRSLQQGRDEPGGMLYLISLKAKGNKADLGGGFTLQHPCTLSDIASHHSFPLKVFLFCFLYFSTQCSDVFVFLFLVCWYEPGFDFSPDCIPRLILSLPLSYASQYESTPTEADDRQINYSDAC